MACENAARTSRVGPQSIELRFRRLLELRTARLTPESPNWSRVTKPEEEPELIVDDMVEPNAGGIKRSSGWTSFQCIGQYRSPYHQSRWG